MSTEDDKHKEHIDALEALAAGRSPAPGEGGEAAEAESLPGTSSGLMLLSEDEQAEAPAEDFLQQMSAQTDAADNEALGDLAAAAGGGTPGGLDEIAAASDAAAPMVQPGRAARLQASVRRSHAHAYKRTMIPLLLVVGVLLIGLSVLTLVMLMGGPGDDPDSIAAEGTYLRHYGKFFILAALPLGAILLMGAWLFYLDVKRAEARMRR